MQDNNGNSEAPQEICDVDQKVSETPALNGASAPGKDRLSDLQEGWDEFASRDPLQTGSLCSLDDIGNGQRFVAYFGQDFRLVAQGRDTAYWRIWGGMGWRDAHEGEMINRASAVADNIALEVEQVPEAAREAHEKHANHSRSGAALYNMLRLATGNQEICASPDAFDQRPELLNTISGTIDFTDPRDVKCRPHERGDLLTKLCMTPYDPNATSDRLTAFLDKFLPDPIERTYVLTALAVAVLVGGNSQRSFLMLLGPTTTGKSALMSLVTETLGRDYVAPGNASIFRGSMEDRPRPDVIRAISIRLVIGTEASDSWELHADQVKRITGGDKISARGMASNIMREQIPLFTPIFPCNKAPRIKGADEAIRRRLRVMVMDKQIPPDQDTGIEREALVNDLGARMALLALLVRLYEAVGGQLPDQMPPRFQKATDEVFAAMDDVSAVLDQLKEEGLLVPAPPGTAAWKCVRVKHLYAHYVARARDHSEGQHRAIGIKQFTERLHALKYTTATSNNLRLVGWVSTAEIYDPVGVL